MKSKIYKLTIVILIIVNILTYILMIMNWNNGSKKCCEFMFENERYQVECYENESYKYPLGPREAYVKVYDMTERKRILCYGTMINNKGMGLDSDNFKITYNAGSIIISFCDYRDREVDKYTLILDE